MKVIQQINNRFQIAQREEGDIYENDKLIFNIRDGKSEEELLALDIKLLNNQNNALKESTEKIKTLNSIILNDDQNAALIKMLKWYNSSNDVSATLTGSAGSGKTTIVNNFLQNIRSWEAIVTAPTHKAKKKIEESTGLKSATIQKLLGLRPNVDIDDFNINKVQFDILAEPTINKYKLIVIDECSMLNKGMTELILRTARQHSVKILFVGDALQLPPVHESKSESITNAKNLFTLNVIIRQKESNPIRTVLAMIREDIVNGTNNFRNYLKQNPKSINDQGEGYVVVSNRIEFMNYIIRDFQSSEFQYDRDHARHHAWLNTTVKSYNASIRKILFGEDVSSIVIKGDTLMAYNSIMNDTGTNNIMNSAEYVVQQVEKGMSSYNIIGYITKVETLDDQISKNLFIVDPISYDDFTKKHNELLETALKNRGMAWRRYYAFKEQHLLIDDIRNKGKLVVKKDIDYAYSITVHKTQGSTYGTSFISGDDIDKNQNFTERKQLWYVALSRAKTKVIIFLP